MSTSAAGDRPAEHISTTTTHATHRNITPLMTYLPCRTGFFA
jgi:hypothetical protein